MMYMDTDSLYFAISGSKLDDVIKPELRDEYERVKGQWLACDAWSMRTPGIFKLEHEGSRGIALCSKCYWVGGKYSCKGTNKRQNEMTWEKYKAALYGNVDRVENRGFRVIDNKVLTYTQHKLGLSAYYDKRRVSEDLIHTDPLEC